MGNLNTSILFFKIKYRKSNCSVLFGGYICMNVDKHVKDSTLLRWVTSVDRVVIKKME